MAPRPSTLAAAAAVAHVVRGAVAVVGAVVASAEAEAGASRADVAGEGAPTLPPTLALREARLRGRRQPTLRRRHRCPRHSSWRYSNNWLLLLLLPLPRAHPGPPCRERVPQAGPCGCLTARLAHPELLPSPALVVCPTQPGRHQAQRQS